MLYILSEKYTEGYNDIILTIIPLLAIFCGILVIISKNPIISILYLIGLFLTISIYLLFAGMGFIGISYILVYIGAISILFLFIIMLINIRISDLLTNTNNGVFLSIAIPLLFNFPIYDVLPKYHFSDSYFNENHLFEFLNGLVRYSDNKTSYVTSNIWDGNLAENSHITSIGSIMYTSHSLWLIITSIILLVAMVGSIVITIKQKD